MGPESYSLFELNEFIRRTVALNFGDAVWVRCEVVQCKIARGHYFLSLAQKDEESDEVIARAEAILWAGNHRRVLRQRGKVITEILKEGMSVMLYIKVDYHEVFGFRMLIEDIDPSYTIGQLELEKRETIEALSKEGLLEKNASLPLPTVLQNIAVISSLQAAGFQDFKEQLGANSYGYYFSIRLFPSALQGKQMVPEMLRQLERIEARASYFDAVVIIRGGGGRLDLLSYDNEELCRKVANLSLPVLAGVGHEIDETVLDMVAHQSLKTPTAVAEYLIHHSLHFESYVDQIGQWIQTEMLKYIQAEKEQLKEGAYVLQNAIEQQLSDRMYQLQSLQQLLPVLVNNKLRLAGQQLKMKEQEVDLVNPLTIMQRGYGLIEHNGKLVKSAKQLKKKDKVRLRLSDGSKDAEIL